MKLTQPKIKKGGEALPDLCRAAGLKDMATNNNILKRVDTEDLCLPTDRFQSQIDEATKIIEAAAGSHFVMWTTSGPNLVSLNAIEVNIELPPSSRDEYGDNDRETCSWAGMYSLDHEGDEFYFIGNFQQDDYKIRGAWAIVGPSKEKVLALSAFLKEKETGAKRALAPKYVFGPRGTKTVRPSYDWDKVILPEETRKLLQQNFSTFFKGSVAFDKAGVAYRRGILLAGPAGCGKTSILKAVMSQYPSIPFFIFEKAFDDVFVEDLRALYKEASKLSPAVVVIEDIDRLVDTNFPLADLLNVLDGLGTSSGVMTIATANNPENIDPALVERPSRFDLVVRIPLPDKEHRKGYIKERATSLEIELSGEQGEKLLTSTNAYTMAQLQEVFVGAVLIAFSEDAKVSYDHLLVGIKNMDNSLKVARKTDNVTKTGFGALHDS